MTCLVCGSPKSEPHFGGNCCRACAAFFRRYFHSKKLVISCTCKTKSPISHPCRGCRVAKCYAVGMTPAKIHGQRDINGKTKRSVTLACTLPSTSNVMNFISPRTTFKVSSSLPNFYEYEKKRGEIFGRPCLLTLFEVTSLTKQDIDLSSQLISDVFPDFQNLSLNDKKSLIQNFIIKIWNIDPILDHVAKRVEYKKMKDEDIQNLMMPLFVGSFMKGEEMENEDIWRTFGACWKKYYEKLVDPICDFELDQIELISIVWILFFDHAFINISRTSSDLCWNIRKVILQELKNYEIEKYLDSEDAESRFLEILEIPLIVERGDQQFHDEMILCEMNKLRMHDDFKAIVKKQRI